VKVALGLASLAAGLLLGEGLVGRVAPQVYRRPPVWQFDPQLGWSHLPSSSGRLVSPEFDVEFRIDRASFRDRGFAQEKPPSIWRALALGDSFVEGWGVPVEASVSKRLEVELGTAFAGRQVEVLNLGVAGYGTDQELLLYGQVGRRYQPDWVLLFFYGNDLWNNAARKGIGAERGDKPHFVLGEDGQLRLTGVPVRRTPFWDEHAWEERPWSQRLDRYLSQHWHLYVLVRRSLAPEVPERQQQDYYQGLYSAGDDPGWERIWELTGRLLQEFRAQVAGSGARMLLVYVPAIVQVEEENWRSKRQLHGLVGEYDLDRPNRRLTDFSEQYHIPYLDLTAPFRLAAQAEVLYFRDSHWNPRGHALAASLVGERLRATGDARD
jgi:hypothetical protein